jgi:hypothetical protein
MAPVYPSQTLLKKKIQKEMLMNMHINLEELNKRTKI